MWISATGTSPSRTVGGCGSNLGLEVLSGNVIDGDRFNYVTTTQDGKILRSSSIYLKNDEGKVIGSICVNLDITDTLRLEGVLRQYNRFEDTPDTVQEHFATNVNGLFAQLIKDGQDIIGQARRQHGQEGAHPVYPLSGQEGRVT